MLPDPAAFEPGPAQEAEAVVPSDTPDAPDSPDRHLLDAVIDKTSELLAAGDTEHGLEALLAVAGSYAGQPLAVDPVGVALVRASLAAVLQRDAFQDELWDTMTVRITATLFDDPHSLKRLTQLWRRLQETAAR